MSYAHGASVVALEEVLATDELNRRIVRRRDVASECEALRVLAAIAADDPQGVFAGAARFVLTQCEAGSSGVSLIERTPDGAALLRRTAACGAYAATQGETAATKSPCAHCLATKTPHLYVEPHRHFECLANADSLAVECLVAPILLDGDAVGTVWIASHSQGTRFDSEDLRTLQTAAHFAAAAYRESRIDADARDRDSRLRLALEAGRMGSFDWDLRTGRVEWSENQERIHGLEPGSFDGTFETFVRLIHPDDLAGAKERIESSLKTKRPYETEFRILTPAGEERWVAGRGQARFDDEGAPLGIVGVCTDVTERKRSEEQLRRAERTSRFLAEASSALAFSQDRDAILSTVARLAVPAFADWCAVDLVEEGELRRLTVVHSDPAKIEVAEELRRSMRSEREASSSVVRISRTGEPELVSEIDDATIDAAVSDAKVRDAVKSLGLRSFIGVPLRARESVLGVMTFAIAESDRRFDRSDLALAEDLARRTAVAIENVRLYQDVADAARRKDEFLAMLGHELRNPLSPIRSGLELLSMSGVEPDVVRLMQEQTDHLVRLVDDLLDVSRIVRGRVELKRGTVDVADAIRRAVETVRPAIEAAGQTLTVESPREPVAVDADPVRIVQALTNLLTNASKYTPRGGRISIAGARRDEEAVFRVADDGNGIDPELLPHVFELFTQSTRTIDRSQGGLGLGLAIVKNLVEMHGGRVTARSDGPHRGSVFEIRLPALADSAAPSDPEIVPTNECRFRRVLVVDDNVSSTKILTRLLGKLGTFEVIAAHDGESALSVAEAYRPELVLLDVGLPKIDGHEVARRMRACPATREATIVALTGFGTEDDRRKSLDAGCDVHLVKPPSVSALQALLSRRANAKP